MLLVSEVAGLASSPDPVATGAYPPAPEGTTVYVVGDVHGRADLLTRLQTAIDETEATRVGAAIEIYLGDYVDRGPDSAAVLDLMIERVRRRRVVALCGNHEVLFERFLDGKIDPNEWRRVGGFETLMSYGVDVRSLAGERTERWVAETAARVPTEHRAFLNSLPSSFDIGDYFFAHAGVRPGVALDAQQRGDLLWIRSSFLGNDTDHGAIIVHGHTPVREPEFLKNRINIDCGAYMTGRLTCLAIDAAGVRVFR